jgi:hypothetical protein
MTPKEFSVSAQLITITELSVKPDMVDEAIDAWLGHHRSSSVQGRVLYRGLEEPTLMELAPVGDTFTELPELRADWLTLWHTVGHAAESDFSRQLLHFVEAPKPVSTALPETPYVQLRHVEVPPPAYRGYRSWRAETIFDVVTTSPEVEAFAAYHSVLSSEPGVMFVSGFSCPPAEYGTVFASPGYQEIVRQAGNRFITGGERGLYTRMYARVTPPAVESTGDAA